jgi:hypothetical protein
MSTPNLTDTLLALPLLWRARAATLLTQRIRHDNGVGHDPGRGTTR